jgi:hypothetical protein
MVMSESLSGWKRDSDLPGRNLRWRLVSMLEDRATAHPPNAGKRGDEMAPSCQGQSAPAVRPY